MQGVWNHGVALITPDKRMLLFLVSALVFFIELSPASFLRRQYNYTLESCPGPLLGGCEGSMFLAQPCVQASSLRSHCSLHTAFHPARCASVFADSVSDRDSLYLYVVILPPIKHPNLSPTLQCHMHPSCFNRRLSVEVLDLRIPTRRHKLSGSIPEVGFKIGAVDFDFSS